MIFDRQEFTTATTNGSGTIRESKRDAVRRTLREWFGFEAMGRFIGYLILVFIASVGLLTVTFAVYLVVLMWREII